MLFKPQLTSIQMAFIAYSTTIKVLASASSTSLTYSLSTVTDINQLQGLVLKPYCYPMQTFFYYDSIRYKKKIMIHGWDEI